MKSARFNRDRFRRKLTNVLTCADDIAFHMLVWAVDRLQNGDVAKAKRYLDFPSQAVGAKIGDPYFIPQWELETLLNERLLLQPLQLKPDAQNRVLNCRSFDALGSAVNLLRQLEDAESGVYLRRMNAMREMPRIGHRQFEWQRGFWNAEVVYRWPFLFGGPLCSSYFEAETGLSIPEFVFFGVCLHGLFEFSPNWPLRQVLEFPNFGQGVAESSLRLLSSPLPQAREGARRLQSLARATTYKPSQYRRSPIIVAGDPPQILAPLRDLIQVRITSGLFYDVAGAHQAVRNEIGERFETYCRELLQGALPALSASPVVSYRFKGNPMKSPDVLLEDGNRLVAVLECKARKMSFAARYAEDPVADGGNGFDELIKGICQIWRFFSHVRLGFLPRLTVDQRTAGVLLTLDNWMTMSGELQKELLGLAREMTARRFPEVTEADQRPVVFCSIEELEQTLAAADEAQFLDDLQLATEDRYFGWILPNIHRQANSTTTTGKPYPFAKRIGEVLPWWDELEARAAALAARA
jgi:hypothetical protein